MEKIRFYFLQTDDVRVKLTNLGARILEIWTKDASGEWADIVLGFEKTEDIYQDDSLRGAVVGRVANRISGAAFDLNGRRYELPKNCGEHSIHGGVCGFDKKIFEVEDGAGESSGSVTMTYVSVDGEEGFPGNLTLRVTYMLDGAALRIRYHAVCDQDTIFSVTNHTYFNLTGDGRSILDHELYLDSDVIAWINEEGIPDGRRVDVTGTPFDFREFRRIGERIGDELPLLASRKGYDHPFWLRKRDNDPASDHMGMIGLRDPASGRMVMITTDLPVVQVYTGNYLADSGNGRNGSPYPDYAGVALETGFLADSIHVEKESPTILRKGEVFEAETNLVFGII